MKNRITPPYWNLTTWLKVSFVLILAFSNTKSKAQSTYNISIILSQDTLGQGQLGAATYLISGTYSNLNFNWEYQSLNSDNYFSNSTLTSNNDTIHYSYSEVGNYFIRLFVFENFQIVDTILKYVHVKSLKSLQCISNPPCNAELVCNGDFELSDPNLQGGLVDGTAQLYEAVGFDNFAGLTAGFASPTCGTLTPTGTPDYFSFDNDWLPGGEPNYCVPNTNPITVDANNVGIQASHNGGIAYAGIRCYHNDPITYYDTHAGGDWYLRTREYITGKLVSPLLPSQTYYVTFWVSLSDYSNFAIENIGLKFLTHTGPSFPSSLNSGLEYNFLNVYPDNCSGDIFPEVLTELHYDNGNIVLPDIVNTGGIISDKDFWVPITGTFTSVNGGENFFVIGNFNNDANTNSQAVSGGLQCIEGVAFYYVDDISVSSVPTTVSITATPNPVCSGQSVTLTASPALPGAQYNWYDAQGNWLNGPTPISGQSTWIVNPTATTTYSVKLFTQCDDPTASITINVGSANVDAGPDQTVCPGGAVNLSATTTSSSNQTYEWFTGTTSVGQGQNINITPTVSPTIYTVVATDVTSGCTASDNVIVNFFNTTPMTISAPNSSCCTNPNINVNPDYINYSWTITPFIPIPGQGTAIITPVLDPNTTYDICLSAIDINGCKVEQCVHIRDCCTPNEPIPTIASQEFGVCSNGPLSISQLAVNSTNNYIVFYQDLIIDQSFSFNNCEIRMAPGTTITVNDSVTLIFNESVIKALCPEMWNGITVFDPSSTVRFTKSSEIWDAIDAVYSDNGGIYQISDSTQMVNNHRSLVVTNFTGIHPGNLDRSDVYTTSANLYPPYAGQRMYQGVYIANGGRVTIGKKVNFTNMDYGVYSVDANVDVYGNKFDQINRPTSTNPCALCPAPVGTAIYAGTKLIVTQKNLRVGSNNTGDDNKITNGYIGIESTGKINQKIIGNLINNMEEAGIVAMNGNTRDIQIKQNEINRAKIGIHLIQMPLSDVNIHKNIIKNVVSFSCPFPCVDNTGIMIENTAPATMTVEITDNEIEKKRTGIWLRLVNGPNVKIHKINTGNQINFTQTSFGAVGGKHYGIRLEKCNNVTVDENIVTKSGINPTSANFKNILGISTENSTNCVISENSTEKMGVGLWIHGSCQGTVYGCNIIKKAWNSVSFDINSINNITDQIVGGVTQANEFINNLDPISKISGNQAASNVDWYYNSSGIYSTATFSPIPFNVTGIAFNPLLNQTTDVCAVYFFNFPGGGNRSGLLPIINNQRTFSSLQVENEFWDKDFSFNSLYLNSSWMNTGYTDDTIYQNYYNSLNPSCIHKYCGVKQAIENDDYILADSINNQIQGNCQIEANRKNSTYILLKFIQGDALTNADSTYLDAMAYSDPFIYGEAVMTARVILQLDPLVNELRSGEINEMVSDSIAETNVKLYPNPTKDYVTLEISEEIGTTNHYFEIIDISGRIIFSNFTNQNKTILDLTSYENGIYFINILIRSDLIERKKLIISNK